MNELREILFPELLKEPKKIQEVLSSIFQSAKQQTANQLIRVLLDHFGYMGHKLTNSLCQIDLERVIP